MSETEKTVEQTEQAESQGRDISAPLDYITIDGVEYKLAFNNEAFRIAEDVYELRYHHDANFAKIVAYLTQSKLGAIMAVFYGALVSAGTDMPWDDFKQRFNLMGVPGVKDKVLAGVQKALPKVDDGAAEDTENP